MHAGWPMVRWMLAGACLFALGCSASHSTGDAVPLSAFCDAFFDAMCEPLTRCDCGDTAEAMCRAQQADLCPTFPSSAMTRAVDEGRLHYDADAAAALVARTRARAAHCQSFVDSLDWQVADLFTVGGVFEGTVPAGGACSVLGFELISECRLGSCAPNGGGYGCRAAVGVGDACDDTHQCADLDARLTTDFGIDRLALRCVPASDAGTEGVCRRRLGDGEACASDTDCESNLCQDQHCRSRPNGESCVTSRECASGYCSADGSRCAPGMAPDGASCDDPAACASHVCVGNTCLPAGCGTF